MGMKLSIILGGLLLATAAGSFWYIDRLQDNIAVLKANAMTLEAEIQVQNEAIKKHLAQVQKTQQLNDKLAKQHQEAQREVTKLRDTFARHDLDNLALAKPTLVQKMINKGTKKVKEDLIQITDPEQFDKDEEDTNTKSYDFSDRVLNDAATN